MKGLEIRYKETIKVTVDDGSTTFHVFDNDGNACIYLGCVNYMKCERYVWFDFSPIFIGEKFEIKVTEIDAISDPNVMIVDKNIKRPKTKLEFFRELEDNLKKQGLI